MNAQKIEPFGDPFCKLRISQNLELHTLPDIAVDNDLQNLMIHPKINKGIQAPVRDIISNQLGGEPLSDTIKFGLEKRMGWMF